MTVKPAVVIRGLGKTFQVTRRKSVRGLDSNTFAAFAHLVRQSVRPDRENDMARKSIRYVQALEDVNLEVATGEVLGVIGRNGAGKSTLLKILAKVVSPSRGHVEINGRVVSLLELGIGFDPQLTVRENIHLNGQLAGMSLKAIKAAEDEILEFADLTLHRDSSLQRCPGGSFVRLAFATMMGIESDIVLADEVLAVGDAKFRAQCEERIRNVAKTGEAVLFVSHDMDAIRRICTRVVWIDHGRIRQVGTPAEVVDAYLKDLLAGRLLETKKADGGGLATQGIIVDLRLASEPGKPIGALQLSEDGYIEGLVHLSSGGIAARLRLEIRQGKHLVFKLISPWTQKSPNPQNHSLAVHVPRQFLNEANYTAKATLELTENGGDVVEASSDFEPLAFQAMNTDNASSVWADWTWSRRGLIGPRIDWTAKTHEVQTR